MRCNGTDIPTVENISPGERRVRVELVIVTLGVEQIERPRTTVVEAPLYFDIIFERALICSRQLLLIVGFPANVVKAARAFPIVDRLDLAVSAKMETAEKPFDLSFLLKPGNGKKCVNGGNPSVTKCSARNDCPNVKTADGITYKGVCGTSKKADGQYTCKCTQGKKLKKKKNAGVLPAAN